MNSFFKELFAYSRHCNQEWLKLLLSQPAAATEKTVKLMSHLINAHHIWNSRIQSKQSTYGVWDLHTIGSMEEIDSDNYQQSLDILDKIDIEVPIRYTNSRGETFTNSGRDILFHIVNHSTYHRAQIASELKSKGVTPLATDYIFYKR